MTRSRALLLAAAMVLVLGGLLVRQSLTDDLDAPPNSDPLVRLADVVQRVTLASGVARLQDFGNNLYGQAFHRALDRRVVQGRLVVVRVVGQRRLSTATLYPSLTDFAKTNQFALGLLSSYNTRDGEAFAFHVRTQDAPAVRRFLEQQHGLTLEP
jgi:hypothetical protein